MRRVFAKHPPYDDGHLGEVIERMRLEGQPTIRVIQRGDDFYALEGSHRLAAAEYLNVVPQLVVEIPDADEGIDEFWARVAPGLPRYYFEKSEVLDLKEFVV